MSRLYSATSCPLLTRFSIQAVFSALMCYLAGYADRVVVPGEGVEGRAAGGLPLLAGQPVGVVVGVVEPPEVNGPD